MRAKRAAQVTHDAPLSAALTRRGPARDPEDDGDAPAGRSVTRLIALLGIGLVAAAILLPSGESAVVVPGDALEPATAAEATPSGDAGADADGADALAGAPSRAQPVAGAGSSAASVAGDDLARAAAAGAVPPRDGEDPAADEAKRPEERRAAPAKQRPAKQGAARRRPKRTAPIRRRAPRPTSAPPAASGSPAPARSAAPRAPASAPRPPAPPRRARGGPSAEFGGL